ncbi:MAG: class I SAM-dependent methyltransferase [Myxococcota bacterium]
MSERSRHVDRFNHDDQAARYDADAQNERDPIRAGYAEALAWVAARAAGARRIADLGAGTGNLTVQLPAGAEVVAVDVSAGLLDRAKPKLAGRAVRFVEDDLLAFARSEPGPWDAVVSSYAVHHLEEPEKHALLEALVAKLSPGGAIAVADLMFDGPAERARIAAEHPHLVPVFDDEFFWDLPAAVAALERQGLQVETQRFSLLSWGLAARR